MGINTRDNDEKQAGGPLSSNPDTRAEDIANALDQLSYEQQQFAGAYSGILSPQDLVDIANKIIEIQDDEEFMKALSETLSGRQFARYFQDAKDVQRLRQKLEAKNGRDLLYLALLQDQIDHAREIQVNMGNALKYLEKTGDIEGTLEMPDVADAIAAWEAKYGVPFDKDHPDAAVHLKQALQEFHDAAATSEAKLTATKRAAEAARAEGSLQNLDVNNAKEAEILDRAAALSSQEGIELLAEKMGATSREDQRILDIIEAENSKNTKEALQEPLPGDAPGFMRGQHTPTFNAAASQTEQPSFMNVTDAAPKTETALPDFMKS